MMTLAHQTRIAVQIVIEDDTGRLGAFLLSLAALIGMLVRFGQLVSEITLTVSDLFRAIDFTVRVFVIGLKAFTFGLGVPI